MPESPLVQKETVALSDLEALIVTRAKTESETELGFRKRIEREEAEYRAATKQRAAKYQTDNAALEAEYARTRDQHVQTFQRDTQVTKDAYAQTKKQIDEQLKKDQRRAKKAKEETGWQALAFFEGSRDEGVKWRRATDAAWNEAIQIFHFKQDESEIVLKRCGRLASAAAAASDPAAAPAAASPPAPPAVVTPGLLTTAEIATTGLTTVDLGSQQQTAVADAASATEPAVVEDPLVILQNITGRIDEGLIALDSLKLPRFLRPDTFVWPFLLLGGAVAAGLGLGVGVGWTAAAIAGVVTAIVAGVGAYIGLAAVARPKVSGHVAVLRTALSEAEQLIESSKDWIKNKFDGKIRELETKRESTVRDAEQTMATRVAECQERHQAQTKEADTVFPAKLDGIRVRRDEGLKKSEEHYPPRITALKEKYESDRRQIDEEYRQTKENTQKQYTIAWNNLIKTWTDGMASVNQIVQDVRDEGERRFLDWSKPELDGWKPPTEVPPGMRFGAFDVDLDHFPNGTPRDPRLKSVPTHFQLPALLPFPIQGSLLIKAADQGKDAAITLLQSLMLRYLTSVPAGKVRFTIVDPVGLGENFAAFMHLGDYHELLVTNRIWTEAQHIEQKLTDLTEHMENVIQKYLRNEFETIEEYNTMAGEVAEPFRILVVANFPTNFNDAALRRLISIVNSGARCGVYALILLDTKLGLPSGFQIKELENPCVNMIWKEGRLSWREPNFGRYPLSLDGPPQQARFSELLHKVGVAARDANRVEVPFDFIAPKPDLYWTFDSSKGVDIPLGRAGATKLQHLKLGKGTSQHVLTAGKTGSGKSTLLHALITNGALRYSPNELELYLIDFKKGVEFKVYAAMELPHARVIAVESEREFGLSVLQRLDVELKERGEIYRELGCQDLAGYREARPEVPMPRVLLIVDEFQEFFIEDDKIAQEVTLLLDRLVRQGRAFGMHVILGSQTLGGQYSLPKATLGQMAVRIALQCSEADAHLILSEDNTAARLLTRPGEAIYNDANGMMEGNNLFQVVWLSDERRESALSRIQEMSREQHIQKPPPIVFEGNLPADVSKNPLLNNLLAATEWPEAPKADYAWLGDAIAIKDPTSIVFRPQSGSNVLVVGQNDEAALAMMLMAALSIASQHPPVGPQASRFYLLDGSPVDSALAGQLGRLKDMIPHPVTNVSWRDLATTFAGLAAEVNRRQESASDDLAPVYIFIYDVQRFRDLRKSDDDFGYSRYDEDKPVPPAKIFTDLLRDGPPVGIHTMIWCDSVNNMNRTLDRQGLKEFENRILFQMSANDSSTLIDTPAASKLGENRAMYYSEEENRFEKFRPYGVPELTWLESVKRRFDARPRPASNGHAGGDGNDATPPVGAASSSGEQLKTNGDGAAAHAPSHAPGPPAGEEIADPPVEAL
jgi:DNA segregation ATPase FtsK/SpoIIIE, S-DNA-T family